MTVFPKLQLQQLVDLQKIDDQISEHKEILADIPLQLDSARVELEDKKNILKVFTDEIEALQKQRKDLDLEVQGEIAEHWMSIAQCFAGDPEDPPEIGYRV